MDPKSPDPSTCSVETSTPSGMTSLSPSPSRSFGSSYDSRDSFAFLDYKLPPVDCSEGRVIQHAKQVMSNLFKKHDPMIFKIGYTHNPVWRWTNRLYGYVLDKHKYTNMVVMYQSDECRGPAMLEACLIDIYRRFLVWLRSHFPQYVKPMIHSAIFWGTGPSKSLTMFWISWVLGSTTLPRSPGKPGCKNEKSGGDSVAIPSSESSCSCVYVVYRSFKYPPPVKPLKPFKVISTGRKT